MSDTDSSDEDVPIAELLRRKQAQQAEKATPKKKDISKKDTPKASKASKAVKSEKKTTPKAPKAKTTSAPSRSTNQVSAKYAATQHFYDETLKGKLAQALICRWWYAINWPDVSKLKSPPPGYEPLNGFVGVYVSTRTDCLGKIIDARSRASCPSLKNFMKKTSAELQSLCVTAYESQIEERRKADGADSKLESSLRSELRSVKAINCDKADKEAARHNYV